MRTIETVATIEPDGTLTAKVPSDVLPGRHRVVVVFEEPAARAPQPPLQFHVSPWEGWPADFTYRREEIYGDDGR